MLNDNALCEKLLALAKPAIAKAKEGELVIQLLSENGKSFQMTMTAKQVETIPENVEKLMLLISEDKVISALASFWIEPNEKYGIVPDAPSEKLLTELLKLSPKNKDTKVMLRGTDNSYNFRNLESLK